MHLLLHIPFFLALLLPTPGYATPLGSTYSTAKTIVHDRRSEGSSFFRPVRRLPPSTRLPPLRIALKQNDLSLLPEALLAVSDPASAEYGKHWTPDRVMAMFSPPQEAVHAVLEWLEGEQVSRERIRLDRGGTWIEVAGVNVKEVERLLKTKYYLFRRDSVNEDGQQHYDLVDFVTPAVDMNLYIDESSAGTKRAEPIGLESSQDRQRHHVKRAVNGTTGCDEAVTPECLRTLYNMSSYTPQATSHNSVGIANYYSNIYLQSDLDSFFRNYSPSLVGKSPELVSIDGGSLEQDANTDGGEAGWILQYTMTLVQPQPVQLLQIGNSLIPEFRTANEWLDAVDASYCTAKGGDDITYDPTLPNPLPGGYNAHSCGTVTAPYVVSNSQADYEHRFPQFYLERQCAEFGKLGLMGITVLYAAGNTGVSGVQSGYCLDENGTMNPNATHFAPSWPASCPWVTAVGGTQVMTGAEAVPGSEEVWNQEVIPGFFESGGGGFSNRFPAPAYQKQTVENYLKGLKKSDPKKLGLFNTSGRAYPDLSANANSFVTVDNGSVVLSSGTSGAVPTVASIITLVNDARLAAGKKPVGFINPAGFLDWRGNG
ncbi:hypothetical protein H0H92_012845 [Tricholoma furcatifolium]|nr:hypothetical protein H0H92_012845 [Tricholoma furcatifolium]